MSLASEKPIGEERRFQPEEIVVVNILHVLEGAAYVGFIAGAFFTVVELRGVARDRRTQVVVDIMRHIGTVEFQEQLEKIEKTRFSSGEEARERCGYVPLGVVSHINEQVGLLLRMKLVDASLVHESIGIADAWDKMKPWCLWVSPSCGESTVSKTVSSISSLVT